MNIMRIPLKQSSSVGVWSKYGKTFKLVVKKTPDQLFFDNLINMANQCVCTLIYKKPILNIICKNGK